MPEAKDQALPVGTLEQIRQADDLGEKTVPVPQWAMSVKVRGLTRGEVKQSLDMDEREIGYLHYGLIDPVVTIEEAAEFRGKSFYAVQIVLEEIMKLSGLVAGFRPGDEAPDVRGGATDRPGPDAGAGLDASPDS